MNKKAQFYIVTAIILSVIIYGVASIVNSAEDVELREDFSLLANNFLRESPKVVNYAIYQNKDVIHELNNYTGNFLVYARKINPNVTLFYIYSNPTNVTIKSYLSETTIVEQNDTKVNLFGENQVAIEDITLKVGGKEFVHHVPVEVGYFGREFTELTIPQQNITLQIGGAFHSFSMGTGEPKLEVILKAENGKINTVYEIGDPTKEYVPAF